MADTHEKNALAYIETENAENVSIDRMDTNERYKMSWRTLAGFLALSLAWSSSTYAITGPNSSIGYMVADYPDQANNASWIASSPVFCLVALTAILGASSDRYGKKWFIIGGALLSLIGALLAAFATSINMIIGGSTLTGIGGAALILGVAAGMEIVPAKYRTAEVALMAVVNGSLGAIGGNAVFAACVEHGLGWRWGYKIQAILYGLSFLALAVFYSPPPTRFQQQQTFLGMLKSIDFIGIGLLSSGAVLLTIPLVWGGTKYAWDSREVIPFLVVGPLVLISFGIYEWKGRDDGILHHEFFGSRSFSIYLAFGFVDGMLLYGTSVFIPDETYAVYTNDPLSTAAGLLTFSSCLLVGFLVFGYLSTQFRQFRLPLLISAGLLTLFCGLASRAVASDRAYFQGMIAAMGFMVAGTEVIPVAGIGLLVPSHLIATSNMVLATCRGLGGAMGIAIFSAVYRNKAAVYVPAHVVPVLAKAGVPAAAYPKIFAIVANAPEMLAKVPGLTPETIAAIVKGAREGAAEGYRYVWYCIMASSLALFVLSFFIDDAPHKLDGLVESSLERTATEATKRGEVEV